MKKYLIWLVLIQFLHPLIAYGEELKDKKSFICITDSAGGLTYESGKWVGTPFKSGHKYFMTYENNKLKSVKEFGAPDNLAMFNCRKLEPTDSFACYSNFEMFRFQPSTKKFVMASAMGFTNEFELNGLNLPATSFTPSIELGKCEEV